MENQVQKFLDDSLEISKVDNVPQLAVILFNVKHLESAIRSARNIVTEMRVAAPLFEAEIRPLKLEVKELSRKPATAENRKALSKKAKRLNVLRSLITQIQTDLSNFRDAIKKDREKLNVTVEALRDYYRQNPEEPLAECQKEG